MPLTREFTFDGRDYRATVDRNADGDRTLTVEAKAEGGPAYKHKLEMVVDDNMVNLSGVPREDVGARVENGGAKLGLYRVADISLIGRFDVTKPDGVTPAVFADWTTGVIIKRP